MSQVALSAIRLDGDTQSREELSETTIVDYCEALDGGAVFPPPVVFYDGSSHWLADGFHRVHAYLRAERKRIECDIRQGSQRDAKLFSAGANRDHGLPRTNADKRRSVEMLLRDEEWSKKSARWVAEQCCVGHVFVARLKNELFPENSSAPRAGKDGKTRKPRAANPKPPKPEPANDAEAGPDPEPEPTPPPARGKAVKFKCDGCEMYWNEPKASCVHCEPEPDADDNENEDEYGAEPESQQPEDFIAELVAERALRGIDVALTTWPTTAPLDALVSAIKSKLQYVEGLSQKRRVANG